MAITSRVTKRISSPMTKRNPRPRKYASQAERQAAYRARNVMLEFRAEPKTADNISKIADTLGYPRSDVLLSMVKFALTNHDWARFGLTHKTIPTYKENPTMKPASPAQLAARKRFAEMARSGAFKKKATKRKANPGTSDATLANWLDRIASGQTYNETKLKEALQHPGVTAEDKIVIRAALKGAPYSHTDLHQVAINIRNKRKANPTMRPIIKAATNIRELAYDLENISQDDKKQIGKDEQKSARDDVRKLKALIKKFGTTTQRKTNPAKKTVSQKVSQLVHEGYPQRQAVAVALSEQRAGKVKRNPMHQYTVLHRGTANVAGQVTASGPQDAKQKVAAKLGIPTLAYLVAKKTNPANVKYRNLATDLKGDQRVGYSVHLASQPGHNAIAWFSKKADAVKVAQEAADRTGKDLAVSRVQNYFGAM